MDAHEQQAEWELLWSTATEIQEWFPDGLVYIGGLAVAAHMMELQNPDFEFPYSHDGDFMIALPDFADLRDLEDVVPNRRLSKHQLTKAGLEFDIYVEGHNDLIVPYDAVAAASEIRSGLRVASLEHLLCLKMVAFLDRRHSESKGPKDAKDVLRILYTMAMRGAGCHPERLIYMNEAQLDGVKSVLEGPYVVDLCDGNRHVASKVRSAVDEAWTSLTVGKTSQPR